MAFAVTATIEYYQVSYLIFFSEGVGGNCLYGLCCNCSDRILPGFIPDFFSEGVGGNCLYGLCCNCYDRILPGFIPDFFSLRGWGEIAYMAFAVTAPIEYYQVSYLIFSLRGWGEIAYMAFAL